MRAERPDAFFFALIFRQPIFLAVFLWQTRKLLSSQTLTFTYFNILLLTVRLAFQFLLATLAQLTSGKPPEGLAFTLAFSFASLLLLLLQFLLLLLLFFVQFFKLTFQLDPIRLIDTNTHKPNLAKSLLGLKKLIAFLANAQRFQTQTDSQIAIQSSQVA